MSLRLILLVGCVLAAATWVWWLVSQWFIFDLSAEDAKLYGIRRELVLIEAIGLYIAWRVTPKGK